MPSLLRILQVLKWGKGIFFNASHLFIPNEKAVVEFIKNQTLLESPILRKFLLQRVRLV